MYQPIADDILDQFEIDNLKIESQCDTQVAAQPQQCKQQDFEAIHGEMPAPPEKTQLMDENSSAYPSPTAQGNMLLAGAWQMLLQLHQTGSLAMVDVMWQALLFQEETYVTEVSDGKCWLVLKSTPYSVLLYPAKRQCNSSGCVLLPDTETAQGRVWKAPLDLSNWKHIPCKATPPRAARHVYGGRGIPVGVLCRQTHELQDLWTAAAWQGFPNFTGSYLDKAIHHHGIDCKATLGNSRPKMLDKIDMLVHFLLPDISDKDFSDIMLTRSGCWQGERPCKLVTDGNLDVAVHALDFVDSKETSDYQKDYTAACTKKISTLHWLKGKKYMDDITFGIKLQQQGVHMKKASEKPAAKSKSSKEQWSAEEVWMKEHLPHVVGATLTEVVSKKAKLFTARYAAAPPGYQKSFSRSYGGGRPREQSAKAVFQWIWKVHEAAGGEPCPYEIPL